MSRSHSVLRPVALLAVAAPAGCASSPPFVHWSQVPLRANALTASAADAVRPIVTYPDQGPAINVPAPATRVVLRDGVVTVARDVPAGVVASTAR